MHAKEDDPETVIAAANLAAIAVSLDEVAAAARENGAYWATHTALSGGQVPSVITSTGTSYTQETAC